MRAGNMNLRQFPTFLFFFFFGKMEEAKSVKNFRLDTPNITSNSAELRSPLSLVYS